MEQIYQIDKITFNKQCEQENTKKCANIVMKKDAILKINNEHNRIIAAFISFLGSHQQNNLTTEMLQNFLRDNIKVINEIKSFIDTANIMMYSGLLYDDTYFYLVKKITDIKTYVNIKTYVKILNTEIVGTGYMSTTLIVKMIYCYEINGKIEIKIVYAKIFPLFIGDSQLSDFSNKTSSMMKYAFIKEALIGCWVSSELIKKNRTGTIMCVGDAYITKGIIKNGETKEKSVGIPFTYETFKRNVYAKQIKKKWITDFIDDKELWEKHIGHKEYGFIEMEEMTMELDDIMKQGKFDIIMFFEIMYTKLCMALYGNITIYDDHESNIMVLATEKIRQYNIKSRGHIYKFFMDNAYHIKYIDLESYESNSDRNIAINTTPTGFLYYFKESYLPAVQDNAEQQIMSIMFDLLTGKNNKSVSFCETMMRCLPDRCTDETLYESKRDMITEYTIDLDIDDSDIQEQMLYKTIHTPRYKPFHLWNNHLLWQLAENPEMKQGGGGKHKKRYKFS